MGYIEENNGGEFLYHTSCPYCGSSDAVAVYSGGTSYCFSCGKSSRAKENTYTVHKEKAMRDLLIHGEYKELKSRGISRETCQAYNYQVGYDINNQPVQIANYCNKDGDIITQKLRYKDKTFKFIGKPKQALMFGQHLFNAGGRKLTITEGEIDALSLREAFGKGFPIVSIKNGAQSAVKEIKEHIDWITSFDEIYLWFDNDKYGKKAIDDCIPLLPVGKVKIIKHSECKDCNEVLVTKGKAEVVQTFYNAELYRPDGFVTPEDIIEEALKPIQTGLPWMYPKLTEITYGRRYGEIVALGAGVAAGKTDFIMQQIAYDLEQGYKVATFMLEQSRSETLLRISGKVNKVFYHLPDIEYDKEQLKETIHKYNDKLYMYDNFGRIDWDTIKAKIRSATISFGVKLFYVDNLTALNSHAEDERRHLDALMEEIASLAKELNIWILLVSHLNPPKKGASHEAGGRVEQGQFTGSRAIMRWSHFMMGIERNTLAENIEDRNKGLVRVIKDRFSGKATGQTIPFVYNPDNGILKQLDEEFEIETEEDNKDF